MAGALGGPGLPPRPEHFGRLSPDGPGDPGRPGPGGGTLSEGGPRAQSILADCLQTGRGIQADPVRAVELYQKAAEGDYVPAICDLGLCYESGEGVEADPVQAAELYRRAADQGYAPAQCNLGVCYLSAIGVEKDEGPGPGGGALPPGRRSGLRPRPV